MKLGVYVCRVNFESGSRSIFEDIDIFEETDFLIHATANATDEINSALLDRFSPT